MEWKEMTVGDLCDTISDTYRREDTEVILVNTSDVLGGKILNHQKVENKNLKGQFKKTFKKDDILYSEIRPANKRFAYVDFDSTEHYIASTKLMVLRPRKDVVDPKFLFSLLTSNQMLEELQHLAETRSGTFPQITFSSELAPMPVCVPDFKTQKRIVRLLDAIEKKIDNNKEINENLEQQAQALFKSWFLDYEPWNGIVPDSWINGKLGDFADIKRGGSPRPIQEYLSESGLRWLKISDVTSLQTPFVIDIKDHIIEEGLRKTVFLKAGSLVLSNSATPGVPKILDVDSCIHDGWLYFPESRFSKEYLYLFFKYIRQQLVNLSNGSVFNNLKTDILKGYPTVLPDKGTLLRFDEVVQPMFLQMQNLTRESHRLADTRDAILPQLMSGELDVSNLNL